MSTAEFRSPAPAELAACRGKTFSVPDFLALFGVRVRNYDTVPRIEQALAEAGLATVPAFATCPIRTELLVVAAEATPAARTEAAEEDTDDGEELPQGTLPQHSFKIGDLPSARGGIVSVSSDATLSRATHIMREQGFSQLPVVDGISHLHGVVTWRRIALLHETKQPLTLANAMDTESLPVAEVHQELFSRLPEVSEHGYLLVRDNTGRLCGIVTASDITERFETTARPFFLIGEIEYRLRKCLGAKFDPDAIRAVQQRKKTGDINDLTFGNYWHLLKPEENWRRLNWSGINHTQFLHQLWQVKDIRNEIAHFDPAPLTEQKLEQLRRFAGLLKQLT